MSTFKNLIKRNPQLFFFARSLKQKWHGKSEAELDILPLLVDRQRTAVDVGAHSGLYSQALLTLAPHVVAIEAIPELASGLRRLLPNLEVIHAAASDTTGRIILAIPEGRPGLSSVAHSQFNDATNIRKVDVEAITLDSLFADRQDAVGFIKIDVEGHELAVLNGASEVIQKHRPILLIEAEERHSPGTVAALFSFFEKRNYSGFFMDGILKSLSEFSPADHQSLTNVDLGALDRGEHRGRYVNNFIFIP
jgi:FkbM family methyltransferase